MSASIGSPYLNPKDSTVTLACATASPPNARSMLSRSPRTDRVEVSMIRSAPSPGGQHPGLGGDALGQRLVTLQRMTAPHLLVAPHQDVVGCLEEKHPREDGARRQIFTHPTQVASEPARPHIKHDRTMRDARA